MDKSSEYVTLHTSRNEDELSLLALTPICPSSSHTPPSETQKDQGLRSLLNLACFSFPHDLESGPRGGVCLLAAGSQAAPHLMTVNSAVTPESARTLQVGHGLHQGGSSLQTPAASLGVPQPSSDFPRSSVGKESACNAGDPGSIPGLGRSPGEGNRSALQYSCLENPMDWEAWWATVHGVVKS